MQKFSEIVYQRPDFKRLKTTYLNIIEKIKTSESFEIQKKSILEFNRLIKSLDTSVNLVFIRHSIDTRNGFYEEEKKFFDECLPEIDVLKKSYYEALVNSKYRAQLIEEFGEQLMNIADFKIKQTDKRITEDRIKENKLSTEYSKILASAKIEWEGKGLNLSQLKPYMVSQDRTIRKKAFEANYNFLQSKSKSLDDIYDQMVHLRQGMANKIGLDNFIELGYAQMYRSDYTPEMVAKFRKKIETYIVPLVEKLKLKQSKRIGLESLKFYDNSFKFSNGNPQPKGTPQWILNHAKTMYSELSTETKDFFEFMTKNELLDLETKKGKEVGGYCSYLPDYESPYIFSNFNGTSGDIDVLTHEAGHAFQVYSSRHLSLQEYYWPSSESAEIHSMSMEFFTWQWMHLFFEEDTDKYKFNHLVGALEFLPYSALVDEFQHLVYEKPDLTPSERNATWRAIEKKYQPSLDYDGNLFAEKGSRWQQQLHIYHMPFYYIDYALAQICALQFWVQMQEDFTGAWNNYLKICQAGGSISFLKIVEMAGLKSPFEDGAIEEVVQKVEAYLATVDDSSF